MPVLRRLFPQITKGMWIQQPADARGVVNDMIFADYTLIEDADVLREFAELAQGLTGNSCLSTSEVPVILPVQAPASGKAAANSAKPLNKPT